MCSEHFGNWLTWERQDSLSNVLANCFWIYQWNKTIQCNQHIQVHPFILLVLNSRQKSQEWIPLYLIFSWALHLVGVQLSRSPVNSKQILVLIPPISGHFRSWNWVWVGRCSPGNKPLNLCQFFIHMDWLLTIQLSITTKTFNELWS